MTEVKSENLVQIEIRGKGKGKDLASNPSARLFGQAILIWDGQKKWLRRVPKTCIYDGHEQHSWKSDMWLTKIYFLFWYLNKVHNENLHCLSVQKSIDTHHRPHSTLPDIIPLQMLTHVRWHFLSYLQSGCYDR